MNLYKRTKHLNQILNSTESNSELEVALSSSRRSRVAESGKLNQQLRESEAARIATFQRVEEIQRAHIIALRQAEIMNA